MGVVSYRRAQELAQEAGYDLMLVSDKSTPPVVKFADFGKFCYMQKKNQKAQRQNNAASKVKEVKFTISIGQHDYDTKLQHALEFLALKHRVQITVTLRGRENKNAAPAFDLLNKIVAEIGDRCELLRAPNQEGKFVSAIVRPK
ncbi:MAG: translation initiation factor IF-3 [Victivallaceae bacterium]|nr:translation initiation factor IF-3 [Victivallaceae bacterium]